jgi:hypothetical protein
MPAWRSRLIGQSSTLSKQGLATVRRRSDSTSTTTHHRAETSSLVIDLSRSSAPFEISGPAATCYCSQKPPRGRSCCLYGSALQEELLEWLEVSFISETKLHRCEQLMSESVSHRRSLQREVLVALFRIKCIVIHS